MKHRVFIGVGHGGVDPGAVGKVVEEEANLTIALELKRLLEAAGITVGISRIRDENDDINEEIREANAFRPDLAVEVHNNAGGGDGFEVYVQTNSYAAKSRSCAAVIEAEVKAIGQRSRGIKTNSFGWTRLVNAPAVLLEGFFVDSSDAYDFDTETEQKALAAAYARGVLKYLGVNGVVVKDEIDVTVENAVKDIGLNQPDYWKDVLRGKRTASGSNIKALMDKYHKAMK